MKQDMGLLSLIIICSILTSLAWVGDIVSWAIIGNGFTLDILLFFVAVGLTIAVVVLSRKRRESENQLHKLTDNELRSKLENKSLDKETKKLVEAELEERRRKNAETLVSREEATFFTCSVCGEVIKSKDSHCSACNSPKSLCAVCQAPLSPDDTIVRTPCCQSYAHKEHILNWISMKGFCPNCMQKITEVDLISIVFIDYSS